MTGSQQFVLSLTGILVIGAVVTRIAPAQQPAPEVIQARRFEVVDKNGATRIELGTDADGGSLISLRDKDGNDGILLQVAPSSDRKADISILGKDGKQIAFFGMQQNGTVALFLGQTGGLLKNGKIVKNGKVGATVGAAVSSEGEVGIVLVSKEGKQRTIKP